MLDTNWKRVPSYAQSRTDPAGISPETTALAPFFVRAFAPRPLTLSVAAPVFAFVNSTKNALPDAYAANAGEGVRV